MSEEKDTNEQPEEAPLIPEDLSGHTPDQLKELREELLAKHESIEGDTVADRAQRLALVKAANTVAAAYNEAVQPAPELTDVVVPDTPEGVEEAGDAPVEEIPATAEDTPAEAPAETTEDQPEPVTASAVSSDEVADGEGNIESSEPTEEVAPAVFQASAGLADHTPGQEMSMGNLMDAMNPYVRSAGAEGGPYKVKVASVDRHIPGAIPEVGSSPEENTRILMETRANATPSRESQEKMVKTASLCGPPEIIREIPACVSNSRKVASKFPRVTSRYGHFQWFNEVGIGDVQAGVAHWTQAQQDAVDETSRATWKQLLDLACPTNPETAEIHAIYSGLTVDVFKEFSAPEHLASTINALNGAHARLADGHLLHLVRQNSHNFFHEAGQYGYGPANQGALPTIVDAVASVLASAGFGGRLDLDTTNYEVWFAQPLETLLFPEAFRNDGASHGGTAARAAITEAFAGLGVGYDTVLDQATDATKTVTDAGELYGTALPAKGGAPVQLGDHASVQYPSAFTIYVVDPSSGFYFEKPEINMGFERSPELARQNKSQMFQETFEGLGKQGCSPWFTIDVTTCFEGGRVAAEAPDCTAPVTKP